MPILIEIVAQLEVRPALLQTKRTPAHIPHKAAAKPIRLVLNRLYPTQRVTKPRLNNNQQDQQGQYHQQTEQKFKD